MKSQRRVILIETPNIEWWFNTEDYAGIRKMFWEEREDMQKVGEDVYIKVSLVDIEVEDASPDDYEIQKYRETWYEEVDGSIRVNRMNHILEESMK